MTNKRCMWKEEHAFDYVYGKMDAELKAEYEKHITTCNMCRAYVFEWEQLLEARDSTAQPSANVKRRLDEAWNEYSRNSDDVNVEEWRHEAVERKRVDEVVERTRAYEATKRERTNETAEWKRTNEVPECNELIESVARQQRLDGNRYPYATREKSERVAPRRRSPRTRPIFFLAGAAVLLLAIATYVFMSQTKTNFIADEGELEQTDKTYYVTQQDDERKPKLVNDPATNQFHITPVAANEDVDGAVYVNDVTNELFMHVKGLPPFVEKDYQLWLVHENDDVNSELLLIENKQAILYYKGDELGDVVLLRVSLERKGGSDKPEGPNTFFVDLKR